MPDTPSVTLESIEVFISKWEKTGGSERANYQSFLFELCDVLEVPRPDGASGDPRFDAYVFERSIIRKKRDGTQSTVFADLYKRGCFILETKQGAFRKEERSAQTTFLEEDTPTRTGHGIRGTAQWDIALEKAYKQASDYIHDLPASEGRPPFLMVCDVGYVIELYSEFSCTGGSYVRFPDPQSHRIYLQDLRDSAIRERLRKVWLNPLDLDPSRHAARVTREVANHLARLAKSLEEDGHTPDAIALFLQRCLFTMFAEDIGLLPSDAFTQKLLQLKEHPEGFASTIRSLWREMASPDGWSTVLTQPIAYFNGGLFENAEALPLSSQQIALLVGSAKPDWSEVEPAIFGTLLERALRPEDRHKLGAHYTPRSYVERLVKPTIIDPLRDRWDNVKKAAAQLRNTGDLPKALKEIREFHRYLCQIKVLDPACGSGNFLYVTLEHMKRLEGEVLELLRSLGDTELTFEMQEFKVRPQQFFGLEINERAVAIAQLVLWIGYFQWHKKTTGDADTRDRPLLPKQHTILHRDAVLDYDRVELRMGEDGRPVTIWDGRTTKPHPVTQKEVPDDTARIPVFDYINPRRAEWPEADFIVGNPPFIGTSRMRSALGDGYAEALRKAWKGEVPDSADFVMYWWDKAAQLLRSGKIQRFGFITTNSIHQTFNRRVLEKHMNTDKNPLHIVFAIPDHPWVDTVDGAAVRIAMTVGDTTVQTGEICRVIKEEETHSGEIAIEVLSSMGRLSPRFSIGADITETCSLVSNQNLSNRGHEIGGSGFIVSPDTARSLGFGTLSLYDRVIRGYRNGRDLTERPRGVMLIDLFGVSEQELATDMPALYQHLLENVKPERDQNRMQSVRDNWWLHRRLRTDLRQMTLGLPRYIATVETSKHRFFVFLDHSVLPDNMLVNIAIADGSCLGILSSTLHVRWALSQGGVLGPTPRYNKTRCFETFPFPDLSENPTLRSRLDELGEQLDAHRKRQQATHPDLTMTGMYNVLEKLRKDESLNDKERGIHEQGLVSVLKQIHDDIDAAVLLAYGWEDLSAGSPLPLADRIAHGDEGLEQSILERLVSLNQERAEEEQRGLIRWLRPEFQNPDGRSPEAPTQEELDVEIEAPATSAVAPKDKILDWPNTLPERIAAIKQLLPEVGTDIVALSSRFGRKSAKRASEISQILDTLRLFGHLPPEITSES